jgi:uncharacterized protein RhaS with RHS repeats
MSVAAQDGPQPEGPHASYYRARYCDPAAGRFSSEDPIRFDGGVNFYSYVRNHPTSSFDPWGLCGDCFAQLKYRPTAPGSSMMHAYWYVQNRSGQQFTITGGPAGISLNLWKPPVPPNPQPDNVSQVWWTVGPSPDLCDAVDNMLKAVGTWPQDTIPYNWQGPNSNTAARSIGQAGGFYPPSPPGALGWNTALPVVP